jgi:hypothetical protein
VPQAESVHSSSQRALLLHLHLLSCVLCAVCALQGKAEVVQRALEVQSLPGALPVQMVQPPNGEHAAA